MKKAKKMIALLVMMCLLVSVNMSVRAASVQPRSLYTYASETLSPGGTKYLYRGGGYFYFSAGATVTVTYTANPSGNVRLYFYNVTTGLLTRISTTYTVPSTCTGYFYLHNVGSVNVYVSNISITV